MSEEATAPNATAATQPTPDTAAPRGSVERRRHPRFAVDGEAEVMVSGGMLFRGRIADVSSSGCFIATELYLHMKPGTPVELAFRAGRVTLRMGAMARSVRSGSGAAFAFGAMSDYVKAGLERLICELQRQDNNLKENACRAASIQK
jgi:hypothetical protein